MYRIQNTYQDKGTIAGTSLPSSSLETSRTPMARDAKQCSGVADIDSRSLTHTWKSECRLQPFRFQPGHSLVSSGPNLPADD